MEDLRKLSKLATWTLIFNLIATTAAFGFALNSGNVYCKAASTALIVIAAVVFCYMAIKLQRFKAVDEIDFIEEGNDCFMLLVFTVFCAALPIFIGYYPLEPKTSEYNMEFLMGTLMCLLCASVSAKKLGSRFLYCRIHGEHFLLHFDRTTTFVEKTKRHFLPGLRFTDYVVKGGATHLSEHMVVTPDYITCFYAEGMYTGSWESVHFDPKKGLLNGLDPSLVGKDKPDLHFSVRLCVKQTDQAHTKPVQLIQADHELTYNQDLIANRPVFIDVASEAIAAIEFDSSSDLDTRLEQWKVEIVRRIKECYLPKKAEGVLEIEVTIKLKNLNEES